MMNQLEEVHEDNAGTWEDRRRFITLFHEALLSHKNVAFNEISRKKTHK